MNLEEEIDSRWRSTLDAHGLRCAAQLLQLGTSQPAPGGRWSELHKPGLGGRRRWRWELDDGVPAGRVLFVKCYDEPPLRSQLDRMRRQDSRHSRAWWEYRTAQRLAAAHIPTAAPVAYVEEMVGRLERRSAVLLAGVPGEAFDRAWRRMEAAGAWPTRGPARHDVTRRLARFVAAFHSTGYCHRDLYLCHIFAEVDGQPLRAPTFYLIDLARLHRPRLRRLRWLIKDLAQLDSSARRIGATRCDRLRFLLEYLGLQRVSRRTRWYARRIMRKSDHILARDRRKARTT